MPPAKLGVISKRAPQAHVSSLCDINNKYMPRASALRLSGSPIEQVIIKLLSSIWTSNRCVQPLCTLWCITVVNKGVSGVCRLCFVAECCSLRSEDEDIIQ